MKVPDQPHVKRGWLKNGNQPGDLSKAPRCGAKARSASACQAPAMKNGRCRFHGGKSTGPKTLEGKARSRRANWRHGHYSREAQEERKEITLFLSEARELIRKARREEF